MRRYFQKAIAPVEFPPALRARLDATRSRTLAENFRREAIFHQYRPTVAEALAEDHVAIAGASNHWYERDGRVCNTFDDARRHTHGQHAELQRAHLGRAFDEDTVREFADNYARICAGMLTLEHRADFAKSLGVEPPAGRNVTRSGACARMDDPQWWRRQLRRTWTRRAENVMREIGIVRKGRQPYASDDAVIARAGMKAKAKKFLETHEAVNEAGEQIPLFELAAHSLANPALRRGEFMCRVRGFEEVAREAGHVAQFWTLTAPSAFHAHLSTGIKNPNFSRAIVRDAQAWLCKQWARVRAKLRRLSILLYGFRIAEPHHDATPHWHMLIFARAGDAATIEFVIREYWLSEFAHERGAHEYRCKCEAIDWAKGSAVGYIAKYVAKNIDGAGDIGAAVDEETGCAVIDGIKRVDAWASLHGIRQFQQIGGPPVGLWRELRRLRDPLQAEHLEAVRAPADSGTWSGLVTALGGIERGARRVVCVAERYRRTLKRVPMIRFRRLAKRQWTKKCGPVMAWDSRPATPEEFPAAWLDRAAARAVDRHGREVLTVTRHGETPAERAAGIVAFGLLGRFQSAATRLHRWRIERKAGETRTPRVVDSGRRIATAETAGLSGLSLNSFSSLGPVAITVRDAERIAAASPEYSWIATVPYRSTRAPP